MGLRSERQPPPPRDARPIIRGGARGRREIEMHSHRAKVDRQRREQAIDDVLVLLEPAIARTRASKHADPELKALIRGALEAARQELIHLRTAPEQPRLTREQEFSGGPTAESGSDLEKSGNVR